MAEQLFLGTSLSLGSGLRGHSGRQVFCSSSSRGTAWFLSSCWTGGITRHTWTVRAAGPEEGVQAPQRVYVAAARGAGVLPRGSVQQTPRWAPSGSVPERQADRWPGHLGRTLPGERAPTATCPVWSGWRHAGRGCLEPGRAGPGGVELRAPRGKAGAPTGMRGHGESALSRPLRGPPGPRPGRGQPVLWPVGDPLPESALAPGSRLLLWCPPCWEAAGRGDGAWAPGGGGPRDGAASQPGSGPLVPPRPVSHGLRLSPGAHVLSASQSSPSAGCLLISGPCCQRICPGRPPRSPLWALADSGAGCWPMPCSPELRKAVGSPRASVPGVHPAELASSHPQEASCSWPVRPELLHSHPQDARSPPGGAQGGGSASEPMSPPRPSPLPVWPAARRHPDSSAALSVSKDRWREPRHLPPRRAGPWPGPGLRWDPHALSPKFRGGTGVLSVASSTLVSDSPGVRS